MTDAERSELLTAAWQRFHDRLIGGHHRHPWPPWMVGDDLVSTWLGMSGVPNQPVARGKEIADALSSALGKTATRAPDVRTALADAERAKQELFELKGHVFGLERTLGFRDKALKTREARLRDLRLQVQKANAERTRFRNSRAYAAATLIRKARPSATRASSPTRSSAASRRNSATGSDPLRPKKSRDVSPTSSDVRGQRRAMRSWWVSGQPTTSPVGVVREATGAIRLSITQSLRQAFDAGSTVNPARSRPPTSPRSRVRRTARGSRSTSCPRSPCGSRSPSRPPAGAPACRRVRSTGTAPTRCAGSPARTGRTVPWWTAGRRTRRRLQRLQLDRLARVLPIAVVQLQYYAPLRLARTADIRVHPHPTRRGVREQRIGEPLHGLRPRRSAYDQISWVSASVRVLSIERGGKTAEPSMLRW